jgi:hypothetical protein
MTVIVDQANLYDNKLLRLVKGNITERNVDVLIYALNGSVYMIRL